MVCTGYFIVVGVGLKENVTDWRRENQWDIKNTNICLFG
jgi:hypothetical protein